MQKIFSAKEILYSEKFYLYKQRRKLVVFVPVEHVEKISNQMSKAGAGRIGDYTECSFRTEGTGTFRPGSASSPFSGKKGTLSYEKEIKLEMECCPENLGDVLDAIMKNHPYEEVAYEVYAFMKRERNSSGEVLKLKDKKTIKEILERTGFTADAGDNITESKVCRLLLTDDITDDVIESAKFTGINCVISEKGKKIKLL